MAALTLESGAKVLNEFISLGKELSKLPILPKYKQCAVDLYSICKRILDANENTAKWINQFLYFDFRSKTARTDFLQVIKEYKNMKSGQERQQLKFNCADIENIYQKNLENKIGQWFVKDQSKLLQAQKIFKDLSHSDADMVQFVEENILQQLDKVVSKMEKATDAGDLNKAESARIQCKKDLRPVSELIELFNKEFTDLVIEFAKIAKIPITLIEK
ncbi:hypothetical protein GCM10023187_35160 [Nibrella viscosa]|uniref:Uncharacterized protein n=1 Tax=Nibrella viscosa TaxID=1084524 RepID=A0ABP8KN30_9BACT